jgi:uncharacterized protein (TIGR00297 family)
MDYSLWAIVILVQLVFSIVSYHKKALDLDGILLGNIVGVMAFYYGGLTSFALILFFFVVAEFGTRFARAKNGNKKAHRIRTTGNVLGNSGAALIALILNPFALNVAFFGAISAALSDTLSGEIGLLSKRKPRLITTLQEVKPGTDGGVTILGFSAGLLAALIIGLVYWALTANLMGLVFITLAGFIGSLADSVLGATLERKGILNNASVNFLSSGCGALAAYFFFLI